jgi:hypothetical protein
VVGWGGGIHAATVPPCVDVQQVDNASGRTAQSASG